MNKSDIIKKFLAHGFQINPKALEYLYERQKLIDKIVGKLDSYRSPVIDYEFVVKTAKEVKRVRISITELLDYSRARYSFISNLLRKRFELVNLLSINKIKRRTRKFSLIGVVKQIESNFFTLEDSTGFIRVFAPEEKIRELVLDEIIGVVCRRDGERIIVEKLVYPDVPMAKRVKKSSREVLVSSRMASKDVVVLPKGEVARVELDGVRIVVVDSKVISKYSIGNESLTKTCLRLVKKRHLNPSFKFLSRMSKTDPFLLREPPDLVIVKNVKALEKQNYKGMTLVALPDDYVLSLRTRETFKLK